MKVFSNKTPARPTLSLTVFFMWATEDDYIKPSGPGQENLASELTNKTDDQEDE